MSAPLSPELERFVEEEVHSGHFASREAVIEAALWDMQQRRKETPELKELRRLLALKRAERPPPGYYTTFAGKVVARIIQSHIIG